MFSPLPLLCATRTGGVHRAGLLLLPGDATWTGAEWRPGDASVSDLPEGVMVRLF